MSDHLSHLLRRATHPAVPLAVAAAVLAVFIVGQWLQANQQPKFELYGQPISAEDIAQNSCHDLRYPEIRCFTTWQEMFEDQIRIRPGRAAILADSDKPAYVVRDGVRLPATALTSFDGCHALAFPEIRCFATEREAIADAIRDFPDLAGSARQRLADLDAGKGDGS